MISYNEVVAIEYKGEISEYSSETEIKELLKKLSLTFDEVFILKTCQRLSVYVYGEAFFQLKNFFAKEGIYHTADSFINTKSAVKHLFEVASGIKSNVLGEFDILETIEKYLKLAENQGTIGPFLSDLIHQVIDCGKSIQKSTSSISIKNSFLSAGMDFVYEHYQSFQLRVLVVGSAELAESILQFLQDQEVERIYIVNHTFEEAKTLANQYNAFPLRSGNMSLIFPSIHVVFGCGHKDKLLNAIYEHQERAEEEDSPKKSPIFIDYDTIDTVTSFSKVEKTLPSDYFNRYAVGVDGQLKSSDIIRASEMIENCTEDFCRNMQHIKFQPDLLEYWVKIKAIETEELNKLFSLLNNPSEETRELIKKYSEETLRKVSEDPFNAIRKLAERPLENKELLMQIRKLFNGSQRS